MTTAIERTEAAIQSGNFETPVLRFRVYTLTKSPTHLKAGADFMLYMSFETESLAQVEATARLRTGLELAVVIDGEVA